MDQEIADPETSLTSPSEDKDLPKTNYSQCYKNNRWTMDLGLQQRRETFVIEHKEKHSSMYDESGGLSDLFGEFDCNVDDWKIDKAPRHRRIRFRMAMSEWFSHIPEDLSQKWLVKFCPVGKRRLIISQRGLTVCYNKYGNRLLQFPSSLPGGTSRKSQKEGLTVLDCVLNEEAKTFFILDLLVWNSASFLDCEAELRHCWMRSRYQEFPELFTAYGTDSYKFQVLLEHPADRETIRSEMWKYDSQNDVACDGLIFYHREAPYISGTNQVVTWLKPFMLPEKLNIDIPEQYEKRRPQQYVDFESFLHYVSERRKRGTKSEKMETEDIPVDETEDIPVDEASTPNN